MPCPLSTILSYFRLSQFETEINIDDVKVEKKKEIVKRGKARATAKREEKANPKARESGMRLLTHPRENDVQRLSHWVCKLGL